MKLIALKDFARVQALEDVAIEGAKHSRHIHKGATFDIGKAEKLKDLTKGDQYLVAQLTVAGCVGDATDEKLVKAVQAEVAAEERSRKAAEEREKLATNSGLAQQIAALAAKK